MEDKNKLNEVDVAELSKEEVEQIQELEKKLGGKYYLVAFEK